MINRATFVLGHREHVTEQLLAGPLSIQIHGTERAAGQRDGARRGDCSGNSRGRRFTMAMRVNHVKVCI